MSEMKIISLCAICSEDFSSLVVRELIIECQTLPIGLKGQSWKSVKVKELLSSVYNLNYLDQLSHLNPNQDDDEEIAVCGTCASVLTSLFKFHEEINSRLNSTSYLATKMQKLNQVMQAFVNSTENEDKIQIENKKDDLCVYSASSSSTIKSPEKTSPVASSARVRMKQEAIMMAKNFRVEEDCYLDETVEIEDDETIEGEEYDEDPLAIFDDDEPPNLVRITKSEEPAESHNCPLCSLTYTTPADLSDHIFADHTTRGASICPIPSCEKIFSNPGYIKYHLNAHMSYKPFRCPKSGCPKAFTANASLQHHLQNSHRMKATTKTKSSIKLSNPVRPIEKVCTFCTLTFPSPSALATHVCSHHVTKTREGSLICPFCDRIIAQSGPLRMHLYSHIGGKEACKKGSTEVPSNMKMRSKNKTISRRGIKKKGFLKTGATSALGKASKKSFVCSTCHRQCTSVATLEIHMRIHTGEKPFVCNYPGCGYATAQKQNLRAHAKSKHGKIEVEDQEQEDEFEIFDEGGFDDESMPQISKYSN